MEVPEPRTVSRSGSREKPRRKTPHKFQIQSENAAKSAEFVAAGFSLATHRAERKRKPPTRIAPNECL